MKNSILIIFLFATLNSFAQRTLSIKRFKPVSKESVTNPIIDSTVSVLRKRLTNAGYTNPVIEYNKNKNEFSIETDSIIDAEFINNWLLRPCRATLFETYSKIDIATFLFSTGDHNKKLDKKTEFWRLFNINDSNINDKSSDLGSIKISDTAKFNLLKNKHKFYFPGDCLFAYQQNNALLEKGKLAVFALRNNASKLSLTGNIDYVAMIKDRRGKPALLIRFNKLGSKNFEAITFKNISKPIAIVIDGIVYSAPFVNGPIEGGNTEISGDFTVMEVKQLANMISGGYLPLQLTMIK